MRPKAAAHIMINSAAGIDPIQPVDIIEIGQQYI
jgi:hypothetical protein